MVTNSEFLTAIFGENAPWVHVTDFPYDPGAIPKDKHLSAWKGNYFCRYRMKPETNQYYTISNFYCDDQGQARRRKALFWQTPVIVLDDVREKLSIEEVNKLPQPSYILETSAGSEQWGYILDKPCSSRMRVENLLDGLVANGLAPEGRDPGMKGVTRYVRLPEGVNTKATKLVNGRPFKCNLKLWQPFNRVTMEQLARPFFVDLDAPRREQRVDGAAQVSDHPLIHIPDVIQIKEVRSEGRFDIVCPWVLEHTNQEDTGSAIFTNADGSIGFKCHHGACEHRTGRDLLNYIDQRKPLFTDQYKAWLMKRELEQINFMQPTEQAQAEQAVAQSIESLCDELRRVNPRSEEARTISITILKHVDDLPKIDQLHWHDIVCDLMSWNKSDFKEILKDLREKWYNSSEVAADFYQNVIFVKEINQFYDWSSNIFFTAEAFQNSYADQDAEARKTALQDGRVKKVDRLDYAPKKQRIFLENGILYGNTWSDKTQSIGVSGDVDYWQDHFNVLGWGKYYKHISQWMAFTLRHPDIKINHMLMLGSSEGCGKDFLLYPLVRAMGDNGTVIEGEELTGGFNDYLLSTKYLHINETELGDRREAVSVSNRLKPLAAAPPDTLRVNQKGIKPIRVRNIVNVSMSTNSVLPVKLNGPSRRFLSLWSDFNPRDRHGCMKQEWLDYWEDRWKWMKSFGWQHVVNYLLTEVDLSDFNPAEPPPVTEFLREIQEHSKPPMLQTLELFIKKRHGAFQCDLATATDLADTLRSGELFALKDMYSKAEYFTPIKIGMMLRQAGYRAVRAYHLGDKYKLWILRNEDLYKDMNSKELYAEYTRQLGEQVDKLRVINFPDTGK